MQSEGSFPEEDRGRRPPPSTSSPYPAWFFRLRSPFFRGRETPVQKRLAPLQLLALVQLAQKRPPDVQPTAPRHRPSVGAADLAYLLFSKTQPSSFQRFVHGCATASKKFGFSDWKIGEAGGEAHSTGTFGDGFYGMQTERRMALRPRQPTAENDISTRITNAIVKPSRVMARKGHSFSESRSGLFESRKRTGGNRS